MTYSINAKKTARRLQAEKKHKDVNLMDTSEFSVSFFFIVFYFSLILFSRV